MADKKVDDKRKKAADWGRLGEKITCEYLIGKGFPITETNWRCGNRLEIDIISQQNDVMVFVEVKTRSGKHESAESAINENKIKQIVRAANAYLKQLDRPFYARFDVALIEGTKEDYEFTYIENAFIPPLISR